MKQNIISDGRNQAFGNESGIKFNELKEDIKDSLPLPLLKYTDSVGAARHSNACRPKGEGIKPLDENNFNRPLKSPNV